jgi:hypothetical protein
MKVRAGQIVRISGWAKLPQPIPGSFDGAMVFDNLLGKPGAVRLTVTQDWQRFELIRPVAESQDLTITISLQGLGEMFVDDLKVVAFEPLPEKAAGASSQSTVTPSRYSTFESIRRLNPLPTRR